MVGVGHRETFCPQFTPDGKTIVFTRRDGDVYRVNADGSGFKRLTEGNNYIHFSLGPEDKHASSDFPSLSPDGRQIVHVMAVDGRNPLQITFRKTACGRACLSPDGKSVAFVSWEG